MAKALNEIAEESVHPVEDLIDLAYSWVREHNITMYPADFVVAKAADGLGEESYQVLLQWRYEFGLGDIEGRLKLAVTRKNGKGSWSLEETPIKVDEITDITPEDIP